jgi:ABC-type antimicrobial peptide transport system permease subunit
VRVPANVDVGMPPAQQHRELEKYRMFVLKNAWAALGRCKWRTALIALIALLVSFSAAVDLTVLRSDDTANNETYQSQKASAVIRPNAQTKAKRDGADSSYTDNYLTWAKYSEYATAVQNKSLTFEYTLATSVPVRQSKSLTVISAKTDTSEDKTGGNLTLQAFYTLDAAKLNEYGTYKVTEGKHLSYKTQGDGALISQALAKKNNLKVGDTITVGNPTNASETYTFTVRGIYEYTGEAPSGFGSDAKYAKDNRENVIYTSYLTFAKDGLDTTDATGWAKPDLNIIFTLSNPSDYNTFGKLVKKAKLDTKTYEITSPSLTAYKQSIAKLDSAASTARKALPATLIGGGLVLLALILWAAIAGRRDEIGMAMVTGVSKGRLGWQFMLETFMMTVPAWAVGLIAGALLAKPLGTAWAGGHAVAITSASVWNVIWCGLGACLVLGIIALIRVLCFNLNQLFENRSEVKA